MTESELLMFSAIQNLANNISLSFNMMNNRMKQLETNIEEKIWTKIQRALKTQEEISKVRDEIKQDIHVINAKIKDVQKSYNNLSKEKNSKATTNVRNNIVIRNSRYDERADNNEVTTNLVQSMFRYGLSLPDIDIQSVHRNGGNDRYSGVVVVELRDSNQKREIFKKKRGFRKSRNYSKVYIDSDMPLEQGGRG